MTAVPLPYPSADLTLHYHNIRLLRDNGVTIALTNLPHEDVAHWEAETATLHLNRQCVLEDLVWAISEFINHALFGVSAAVNSGPILRLVPTTA